MADMPRRLRLPLLLLAACALPPSGFAKKAPPAPLVESTAFAGESAEARALLAVLREAQGRFTPAVKAAALAEARAAARRELDAAGIALPAEFLAWVEADPVRAATVYGCRPSPARALVILRSLEIDLGKEAARGRAANLALATAVVCAREADLAPMRLPVAEQPPAARKLGFSVSARAPLALVIPPCPLSPVNTHPTDRPLDVNDHIVNFFEGRTIEVDKRFTRKENGKKVVLVEKQTVPLAACHVMASAALQREFNEYMKAHGQSVSIDCGDGVITPDRHDGFDRKAPESKKILEAFKLFKTAYEAKGLLPAERDATATPAEWIAYLLRNDASPLAPEVKEKWPRFPLNAPWPVMLLLAQNRQPLREADDLWRRWHDRGEFHGYGEYIGGIAQQYDFQSARRLAPYPYAYGSIQMMFKDGGVCGTMANIAARSHVSLGTPSVTAGQPGHCALILQSFDPKTGLYELKGGQFVTGGPDKTHPHANWLFDDNGGRRDMVYHQCLDWATNRGLQSFVDGLLARSVALRLPPAEKVAYAGALLGDALAMNPWNIAALESAVACADKPESLFALRARLSEKLAADARAGSPADSLYAKTADRLVLDRLAVLPAPAKPETLAEVRRFLETTPVPDGAVWLKYRRLDTAPGDLRAELEKAFRDQVNGDRTPERCDKMASRLKSVADAMPNKRERAEWAGSLYAGIAGREEYRPAGARAKAKPQRDPAAELLCRLAGKTAEALALEAARHRELAERAGRDLSKASSEGPR